MQKSTHGFKLPGVIAGMLFLIFTGFGMSVSAQVRTITGTVTASDTKETLPGATVSLKGTALGVVTDIDGNTPSRFRREKGCW